jgi:hypothetical protein
VLVDVSPAGLLEREGLVSCRILSDASSRELKARLEHWESLDRVAGSRERLRMITHRSRQQRRRVMTWLRRGESLLGMPSFDDWKRGVHQLGSSEATARLLVLLLPGAQDPLRSCVVGVLRELGFRVDEQTDANGTEYRIHAPGDAMGMVITRDGAMRTPEEP